MDKEKKIEDIDKADMSEESDIKDVDAPTSFLARTKKYFGAIMGEHRFFPRFLAVRGSIFMGVAGLLLVPAAVLSGLTMTAFAATTAVISLLTLATVGLVNFIPDMGRRLHEAFRVHVQGKEPRPQKQSKPVVSLWKRIGRSKAWNKFKETGFAKLIRKNPVYKAIKNSPIWEKVSYLSRDQEVFLRTYATTGSVGMVVATTAMVLTNAIALPAVIVPAAALMVAGGIATGIVATYHNVKNLWKSGKNALHIGHTEKLERSKAQEMTVPEPAQTASVQPDSPQEKFSNVSSAKLANDNKADKPEKAPDHEPKSKNLKP